MLLDRRLGVENRLGYKKLREIVNLGSDGFFMYIEEYARKIQKLLLNTNGINTNTESPTSPDLIALVKHKFLSDIFTAVSDKLRKKKFYDKESLLKYIKILFERYLNGINIEDLKKTNISVYHYGLGRNGFVNYLEKNEFGRKKHYKNAIFYEKIGFNQLTKDTDLTLCEHNGFQKIDDDSGFICIESTLDGGKFIIHFNGFDIFQEDIIRNLMDRVLDIAKEKINEIQYKYISQVSGCKNGNYFFEHGQEKGYAVVAIDLDNFKFVNDTYGHDFGNEVLRKFGNILKSCIRENEGEVIHLSGDEYALLVKKNNDEDFSDTINKILGRVKQLEDNGEMSHDYISYDKSIKENIKINFSYGVCNNDKEKGSLTVSESYVKADLRMLKSKGFKGYDSIINRTTKTLSIYDPKIQKHIMDEIGKNLDIINGEG